MRHNHNFFRDRISPMSLIKILHVDRMAEHLSPSGCSTTMFSVHPRDIEEEEGRTILISSWLPLPGLLPCQSNSKKGSIGSILAPLSNIVWHIGLYVCRLCVRRRLLATLKSPPRIELEMYRRCKSAPLNKLQRDYLEGEGQPRP